MICDGFMPLAGRKVAMRRNESYLGNQFRSQRRRTKDALHLYQALIQLGKLLHTKRATEFSRNSACKDSGR